MASYAQASMHATTSLALLDRFFDISKRKKRSSNARLCSHAVISDMVINDETVAVCVAI